MPRWHVDRTCRRFDISVPALCRLSSDSEGYTRTPVKGVTGNLSQLGAMIWLPERIPPGTQIEVDFSFPSFGIITVAAIVVWAMPSQEDQRDSPLQHGLRFLKPEMALRILAQTGSPSPGEGEKTLTHRDHGEKSQASRGLPEASLCAPRFLGRQGRKGHEVLIKFRRKDWPALRPFLESSFEDINLTETKDEEILLAYCRFYGDLRELDRELEELRQSAMVGLGDPQAAKFLNFFITLQHVASPSSGPLKRLKAVHVPDLPPSWRKPLTILVLAGMGLFTAMQVGLIPRLPLTAPSPPPHHLARREPSVLQWQPYVEPTYHQAWLAVQEKYRLTDEVMLGLLRFIKKIEAYNPGHSLSDLTSYPQAIDRALGLLLLKDVYTVEGLLAFLRTLEAYFTSGTPFPDEPEFPTQTRYGSLATLDKTFAQQVILTFYEQLLRSPRFTAGLLRDLHRAPSGAQGQK